MTIDASTFFILIALALSFRVAMHFVDKDRIQREIEGRSGRVVSISWNPFGRGWFFEKGERHYEVIYIDRSGATLSTSCKTSLFTGVYWAEGPTIAQPKRIIAKLMCLACGYELKADWSACPNCGKATVGRS